MATREASDNWHPIPTPPEPLSYNQLLEWLQSLTLDQLNQSVTVCSYPVSYEDMECYPVERGSIVVADRYAPTDILDPGQPILLLLEIQL